MSVTEKDWNVERPGFTLTGTLCLPRPEGRFPMVLFLEGSGPVDRDGNVRGQGASLYAKLAHALAGYGVASYRYDKRGTGASGGEFLATGYHDLVDDAQACWEALAQRPECDGEHMYMLGHSEGTAIAAQLSSRVAQRPRALVLLCPFAESAEAMLMHQARGIERELPGAPGLLGFVLRLVGRFIGPYEEHQRKTLARARTLDGGTMRLGLMRVSARWLRELIELDIDALYRSVPCPMLLIAGEKDMQCTPASAEQLARLARVPTEFHVVPDMIHHLSTWEGPAVVLDFRNIDALPLAPQMLALLEDWFARERGAAAEV
ncbi:lysophospholipase [Pelomonas sp. CA6]|uniref:alpha/beta hydrolase family protein n=1 Tax=Pelomonas sp. CA6 TaxID=2907999 RepID=UPI001F4C4CA6|nr:alpha/beta fold hydrolase [Pelomonas sp. CA6]MCH7344949.1 lysophospholipase [Pelomonas sp. CA6]